MNGRTLASLVSLFAFLDHLTGLRALLAGYFRLGKWVTEWEAVAAGLFVVMLGGLLLFRRANILRHRLKREEGKFRALLESVPDAIYIVEPSTLRILGRNCRAAAMDGYSDEDLVHMSAVDLHTAEECQLFREALG